MALKKIKFMDTSFRDGFQSVFGARVITEDFLPALEASVEAGIDHFESGGGARFQSLFFYCNESAFDMMDKFRATAGPDVNLQTLARGINVVGLAQQPKDIINMHARLFKKHGVTTIRNFDALNDMHNLDYSGRCIKEAGLKHQVAVTLMGLPPDTPSKGAHTPEFYIEKIQEIQERGIPYDSLVFKDASGTCTPRVVYETIKKTRDIVGKETIIWFHTHDTAGLGLSCIVAAIEAGADGTDLAKSPVSGGTCQPDILGLWHALKHSDYTLDIDYEKVLKAEVVFNECMEKYMMPPEAKQVSPNIVLSPMPGGALTANTLMMRDTNTLHLYPQVIHEMAEVVARGGFGTSVTPVSQFYFQQAFMNVVQGQWKKMTDGYGNMVLGYFGKTPRTPDPEIVKIAAEQLGKEPFEGDPMDVLEPGIPAATKVLEENALDVSDENIFIAATCKEKGLTFLKGEAAVSVYYKEDKKDAAPRADAPGPAAKTLSASKDFVVTINGQSYQVGISPAV
ncbi:biotin attachment protein [candidate division KSB3 bacterium]|uniref:Biotin attachment protein n=1 Tax=candidate division KSB3 bacterium TaxID=2044937 RepID=A0A2G6E3L3_9BACT|nr:MAG: biotin attachment protein [candidate division KSB3 bacterium]PIE29051.1 MAG: biotin attachment protein [candidate division KSB3 bacterium]